MLTLLIAAAFVLAAATAYREIVTAFNRQTVVSLAQSALTRAEIATDYAVIRLGELGEAGDTGCDVKGALVAINNAVFQSGSIKDILTAHDGNSPVRWR